MNKYTIIIKQLSDKETSWLSASKIVEIVYHTKKSNTVDPVSLIENEILYRRLLKQLDIQYIKITTGENVQLEFNPFDSNEVVCFINTLLQCEFINDMPQIHFMIKDFKKQLNIF